jgi:hypothetical protein
MEGLEGIKKRRARDSRIRGRWTGACATGRYGGTRKMYGPQRAARGTLDKQYACSLLFALRSSFSFLRPHDEPAQITNAP